MATADKPHSPLTVESAPLLVMQALLLCAVSICARGERGGPRAHRPDPQADPNWPFADVEIQ
jgi:hypothetical protein